MQIGRGDWDGEEAWEVVNDIKDNLFAINTHSIYMHITMVTTHHTQMCYMLHVQYPNKCEIEGLMEGERGRSGRKEGEEWEERG